MAVLWINNVEMPDPAFCGITVNKEPIWSKNTGRSSTGEMVGDIIARKYKIKIKWPALSQQQAALIDSAISSSAFFDVKFIDPTNKDGAFVTKKMYAGTPVYPVYSYVHGLPRYNGVAVDLVEQ